MKYVLFVTVLMALVTFLACGDDPAEPLPSPTEMSTPEPGPRTDAIEALRTYVETEGLDGEPGALTSPVECANLPEHNVDGDYCVIDASVFGPAVAIILVGAAEDPMNEAWQVRAELEDRSWRVIETVNLGSE